MPTLLDLRDAGRLVRIDPELDHGRQEQRLLYATPGVVAWLTTDLPGLESSGGHQLSPLSQVDALFVAFCEGRTLVHDRQFKCLRPVSDSVWELKTYDVRLFRWFARKNCFIACFANSADFVKRHSLYRGYVNEVARVRARLNVDGGYIEGSNPDDVVST